uniref:Peptidase S1 domain-containing protein n=2 Tax=Romanomermis culicivorax TaxID=13658 RepID=A0A915JAB5_ROMCU
MRKTATSILPHPRYTPNGRNDIALIKLRSRLQFNDYIRPLCLPAGKISSSSGLKCIICGYGHGEEPHLPTPTCLSLVGLKPIKPMEILALRTDALGTGGIRAGDSGSSLSCSKQGRQYMVGVISSLIREPSKGSTLGTIYANVGHYEKWLKSSISNGTSSVQTVIGDKSFGIFDPFTRKFRKF